MSACVQWSLDFSFTFAIQLFTAGANNEIKILIIEGDYGAMPTMQGQNFYNVFTGTSDTVTQRINAEVTGMRHYFPQKWRGNFLSI